MMNWGKYVLTVALAVLISGWASTWIVGSTMNGEGAYANVAYRGWLLLLPEGVVSVYKYIQKVTSWKQFSDDDAMVVNTRATDVHVKEFSISDHRWSSVATMSAFELFLYSKCCTTFQHSNLQSGVTYLLGQSLLLSLIFIWALSHLLDESFLYHLIIFAFVCGVARTKIVALGCR